MKSRVEHAFPEEVTNASSVPAEIDTNCFDEYTCITCLQPSSLLYKQYSNAKNIKLQTCIRCHHDVDPYIERELLLVIMDMMLLRIAAYRHFFFNRSRALYERKTQQISYASGNEFNASGASIRDNHVLAGFYSLRNSSLGTLGCILIRIVLNLQNFPHASLPLRMEDFNENLCPLIYASLLEFAAQWTGIMITAYFCFQTRCSNLSSIDGAPHAFRIPTLIWKQLHMAIIFPQTFDSVILLVHVYENSLMVWGLGSVFVHCFRYLAVYTVMERWLSQLSMVAKARKFKEHDKKGTPRDVSFLSSLPFLVGLFFEIIMCMRESSKDGLVNQAISLLLK